MGGPLSFRNMPTLTAAIVAPQQHAPRVSRISCCRPVTSLTILVQSWFGTPPPISPIRHARHCSTMVERKGAAPASLHVVAQRELRGMRVQPHLPGEVGLPELPHVMAEEHERYHEGHEALVVLPDHLEELGLLLRG
jgi:hypothetical protein